jgi:signal transduction histidine kinase/AmiR/NasT family two-component response regulator/HPt (histidine-containing phosphotransfer) domain-containing protein
MESKHRILLIDDNRDIHEDYRKVFSLAKEESAQELRQLQADFFEEENDAGELSGNAPQVTLDSAFQGLEGVEMALQAHREGVPYDLAFVDVRMPPGIDGVQTVKKLWKTLPGLNCVLCTAYSDYDWQAIQKELGPTSNLLILKKPFDPIEVLQLVAALTEKTQLTRARDSYRRKLESKVQELTRSEGNLKDSIRQLEVARSELEVAAKAKSEFLANMSHELRTPLNGVIAMTDMLLYTPLDGQQEKYARTARSSGEILLGLINDILDFSKIESGNLELEAIDFALHREIETVITLAARKCQEKRLEMICFIDPRVLLELRGDPGRMRQVLTNLVTNAVKFTERGEIVVEITLHRDEGDVAHVKFSVADTGIGIPRDRHDRLFASFSQVDASMTRRFGGTGLGLAISKQLCDLMGGEIGFESNVGQGTTFWFILPFEKKSHVARSLVPADFRQRRILLVEENPRVREVLVRQLREWDLKIECADDLSSAVERLRNSTPPFWALLVGGASSDSEATQIAQRIHAHAGLPDVHLILLLPLGASCPSLKELGFSAFVNKPVVPSELFNVLVQLDEEGHRDDAPQSSASPLAGGSPELLRRTTHVDARLLLAEDNSINQKVATQILNCFGFSLDIVENGLEAIEALEEQPYDLVLMDCQMPCMDGIEATRVIRQKGLDGTISRGDSLPIIALTANALQGDREKCVSAGMTDYLSKPLRPEQLIEMIEKYLAEAQDDRAETDMKGDGEDSNGGSSSHSGRAAPAPLDFPVFVERCMGDEEFAEQMLDEFRQKMPGELVLLAESIEQGDAERLASLAHTIKGLAANVAADPLAKASLQLEQRAHSGDLQAARQDLSLLSSEWNRLETFMDKSFTAAAAK